MVEGIIAGEIPEEAIWEKATVFLQRWGVQAPQEAMGFLRDQGWGISRIDEPNDLHQYVVTRPIQPGEEKAPVVRLRKVLSGTTRLSVAVEGIDDEDRSPTFVRLSKPNRMELRGDHIYFARIHTVNGVVKERSFEFGLDGSIKPNYQPGGGLLEEFGG